MPWVVFFSDFGAVRRYNEQIGAEPLVELFEGFAVSAAWAATPARSISVKSVRMASNSKKKPPTSSCVRYESHQQSEGAAVP